MLNIYGGVKSKASLPHRTLENVTRKEQDEQKQKAAMYFI